MSFKDKVEGNELDLSLNELTVVPVKELAATPKATHLDLSRNLLQSLPNDFASLTHLVQLDLSSNKLLELPHNFGNLINLQHLELDKNHLKTLPISFCRLKNLRWLDLKDNPLEPKLQAIAGDCIDAKQCQQCAKKVVAYMQTVDSDLERERQKKLREKREKEAIERAKLEKEMEEQRRQKKLDKERRKAASKARQEEKSKNRNHQNMERDSSQSETDSRDESEKTDSKKRGINWSTWFLVSFAVVICGGVFMVSRDPDIQYKLSRFSKQDIQILARLFVNDVSRSASNAWKVILPYAVQVKALLLNQIHGIMLYVSRLASDFESMLSVYF